MTSASSAAAATLPDPITEQRREQRFARIAKAATYLTVFGLGWTVPLMRIAAGDSAKHQLGELWQLLGIPLLGIAAFLAVWAATAPQINTSLGAIPGPAQVWEQAGALWEDHRAERIKADKFYARLEARNQKLIDAGKAECRNPDDQYAIQAELAELVGVREVSCHANACKTRPLRHPRL